MPTVTYTRGPDLGGGVGGLLYSQRPAGSSSNALLINHANARGDIIAQSNLAQSLTWTASYEAFGSHRFEFGSNPDSQRANSKEEDPTGYLHEHHRYRDIENETWLSRDPAGFVDGPNVYAYCKQNPWGKFDPDGLFWSALVTAGFAAYDTYQYATGQTSAQAYGAAMALNGAALLADVSTAGMGGGLAVRALQAGTRLAKAVDRADTAYSTANGAYRTAKDIAEGDGQGALINGTLTALGAKHLGGSRPKPTRLESPTPALPNSAKTTQAEAKDLAEGAGAGKSLSYDATRSDGGAQGTVAGLETRGTRVEGGRKIADTLPRGVTDVKNAQGEVFKSVHTPPSMSHSGMSQHVHPNYRNVLPDGSVRSGVSKGAIPLSRRDAIDATRHGARRTGDN